MTAHIMPRSTTLLGLARVLPPSQVPLAYAAILRTANHHSAVEHVFPAPGHDEWDPRTVERLHVPVNDCRLGFDRTLSVHRAALFRQLPHPVFVQLHRCTLVSASRSQSTWHAATNWIRQLCYLGDLDSLTSLLQCGVDFKRREGLVNAASEAGQVSVLNWLNDNALVPGMALSSISVCLAASNGHIQVLQWWRDYCFRIQIDPGELFTGDVLIHALSTGQIAVLEWLRVFYDSAGLNEPDWTPLEMGWVHAAQFGQVAALDWLKAHAIPFPSAGAQPWVDYACQLGHVHVLDWWYANTDRVCYTFTAVDTAASSGQLDVLKWWAAKTDLVFKFSPMALHAAQKHGHVHVLNWFHTSVPSLPALLDQSLVLDSLELFPRDMATLVAFQRADALAAFGYDADFLIGRARFRTQDGRRICVAMDMEEEVLEVFEATCANGHVHLLEQYEPAFQFLFGGMLTVTDAVKSNHRPTLEWCLQHLPQWSDWSVEVESWPGLMADAIEAGSYSIVDWIMTTQPVRDWAVPWFPRALKRACYLADITILSLLLSRASQHDIDLLKDNDGCLIVLAASGNLSGLA